MFSALLNIPAAERYASYHRGENTGAAPPYSNITSDSVLQ
jgi:hypothetical protein